MIGSVAGRLRARCLVIAGTALLSCGCVRHQAELHAPDGSWQLLAGDPVQQQGSAALPQEAHLVGWRRQADGSLRFASARVVTPLPWWQRFPVDILSDALYPGTLLVHTSDLATERHPPHLAPAELDRLAQAAGLD